MKHTLEDELRSAYAQLPQEHRDPTGVMAASRKSAGQLHRRRTAGVCAGAVAATLVVGTTAFLGTNLGSGQQETELLPAGAPQNTSSVSSSASAHATPHSTKSEATPTKHKLVFPKEGSDKPLAGLSGKLLPHGSQLPSGLLYHGISTRDYQKTWATSRADGYAYSVPSIGLTAAEQSLSGPSNAEINAAYGIVSGVFDMAQNGLADTNAKFKAVDVSIVRFRSPAFAQSAFDKTRRKETGLYWIYSKLTTPNVPWSGVAGTTGDHGVYNLPAGALQPMFLAYQIVGEYIVTADSETAATAEQAVTDMVTNLKTAGLVQ